MTAYRITCCLVFVSTVLSADLQGATEIVPGLTLYPHEERLTGRLTFLVGNTSSNSTPDKLPAAIYQFDLQTQKLRKITATPNGTIITSSDGNAFCVLFWTNAFVCSASKPQGQVVSLGKEPSKTVVLGTHVFFQIERFQSERLLGFEIETGSTNWISLPNASKWEYELFRNSHESETGPNTLHFEYSGFGKRLSEGDVFKRGFYSYDLKTHTIAWLTNRDPAWYACKAIDGRSVWFSGRDAPIHGRVPVSSPWDHSWSKVVDPDGKQNKLIKKFSMFSVGELTLDQMSPCGRFAFVRSAEPIVATKSGHPGWVTSYMIVNVADGQTKTLLREDAQKRGNGYVSQVYWVK